MDQGIAQSFQYGILTHTSAMAPCPWISEAAALVTNLNLVHPLTPARLRYASSSATYCCSFCTARSSVSAFELI